MNTEPATRDFSAFAHDREVKCLVKGNNVIAAERCIDEQKLGCWCEAGYGALRALESMSVETPSQGKGGADGEFGRLQSKRRIDLVQLKARAAGFAKAGQDFAGAALSHMNRETQRKRVAPIDEHHRKEVEKDSQQSPGAVGKRVVGDEGVRPMREVPRVSAAPVREEQGRSVAPDGRRGSAEGGPPTPAAAANADVAPGSALSALINLGHTRKIATAAIRLVMRSSDGYSVDSLVKEALRVIRDGQSQKTPAEQIADIPVGPGRPHTVCKGLPGKPCITILRATSKGDRCMACRTAAEMKTCAKCPRVARKLVDGGCGRCVAAEKQRAPKRKTSPKRPPRAAYSEVAKEEPTAASTTIDGNAVADWLKRGLQIRRALEAKVERLSRELLDAKKTLQQLPKE